MNQESTHVPQNRSREVLLAFVINVIAGVVTYVLTEILKRLGIQSATLILLAAVVVVLCLLVVYTLSLRAKPHSWFWMVTLAVLLPAVLALWSTTIRVPSVVGMNLTDAKAAVANRGLVFEQVEMVKGGSDDIVVQCPEPETRLFRKGRVKLFYGEKPSLAITSPTNGTEVAGHRAQIEGTSQGVVGSRNFHIYLLIRPSDNHVWIQDPPMIGPNGEFSALVRFGTPELGRGEKFQIQAVITTEVLKPGDAGLEIPRFVVCTPVLEISRRN
jgi:hypothetical protein